MTEYTTRVFRFLLTLGIESTDRLRLLIFQSCGKI